MLLQRRLVNSIVDNFDHSFTDDFINKKDLKFVQFHHVKLRLFSVLTFEKSSQEAILNGFDMMNVDSLDNYISVQFIELQDLNQCLFR